jgi:hypothetical protein
MDKETIRIKWIRHTPLLKLDECVDNAMQEYADQQTKHLTEQLAEYKGIAQTESVRADNLQEQLAEKEKEIESQEDILYWVLHNYKPYEDGMTMVWRNINPDIDTIHTSKELYETFKNRNKCKQ